MVHNTLSTLHITAPGYPFGYPGGHYHLLICPLRSTDI
jgi:hypothetical protein